ncbi:MAG: phosphoglycerate kinase [Thermoplasmata archaeon]
MKDLPFFTLDDFDMKGKTVFLRVDINSPVDPKTSTILDDSRFKAHMETINELRNSKLVIMAHQSRPGKRDFTSLKIHAEHLSGLLKRKVKFLPGLFEDMILEEIDRANYGDILLLENTRFYSEEVVLAEEKMDVIKQTHIVRNLSRHMDYFVNDAFAAAHRPNVTLIGFTEVIPNIAGRLMEREIRGVETFFGMKMKPRVGVFGGAKADDSIKIIKRMLNDDKLDYILTGGLVGHLFLMASGMDLGQKNMDIMVKEIPELDKMVKQSAEIISKYGDKVMLPTDFIGSENSKPVYFKKDNFRKDIPAMDIGIDTIATYASLLNKSKAIILNGPMGVFELNEFATGTREIFSAIADSAAYKIAGGGHTNAALEKMGLAHKIDHLSTGGGALISYLAGEPMPAIESLINSKKKFGEN